MHIVDEAAAIVAIKHSQCSRVVTARVETFDFLALAFIGDVVSIPCEIQHVGRTSMEISVKVLAENPRTGEGQPHLMNPIRSEELEGSRCSPGYSPCFTAYSSLS
jgi:acyl-CoA hydrolase